MTNTSITSGNVLIAVTLMGASVTEDNARIYLTGDYINKIEPPFNHVRDTSLMFHKDWNYLIDAVKEFKDNHKIFSRYENAIDEYQEYFKLVNKINSGLQSTNIEVVFENLVQACDWLINLKEVKGI